MSPARRLGAVSASLVAVALVGADGRATGAGQHVRSAADSDPLAIMVLPPSALGPLARGLQLDENSGPQPNEAVESPGPRICRTPTQTAALGRLGGYDLGYEDFDLSNVKAGRGVTAIGSGVERYGDAAAASRAVTRTFEDVAQNVGAPLGGARIVSAESIPAEVPFADEVRAWRDETRVGRFPSYRVAVVVRVGAVVGIVSVAWAQAEVDPGAVIALAGRLRARIAGVTDGQISGSPVEIPTNAIAAPKVRPRLDRLALTPADVGPGAWTVSSDYVRTQAVASFEREIAPGCASPLLLVEGDLTMGRDVTAARRAFAGVASGFGTFGTTLSQVGPGRAIKLFGTLTEAPLRMRRIADQQIATRVRYDGPVGTGDYVFAAVREDRAVIFVVLVGRPGKPVARATVERVLSRAAGRARAGLLTAR